MPIRLYYDLLSQPSRAVYLFMKTNKIPFIDCAVALRKGEHMSEDYAKINPFKKVPAIDHDGFKLTESVAILRYLCRTCKVADHWYPENAQAQARVDEFLEWYHANIRMNGAMYFQTKLLIPLMTKQPVNENRLQRFERGLKDSLSSIENVFLAHGGPYLCRQSDISIADLLCVCELEQPFAADYNVFDGHPRLKLWNDKVQSKLMPQYNEAHRFIHEFRKRAANPKNYQLGFDSKL